MPQERPAPAAGARPVRGDDLVRLRNLYRLWNEGGTDAMIREVWDPDIRYHDPPDFPDATRTEGARSLAEHLDARLEAVPGATFHLGSAWRTEEGEILAELSLSIGGQASGVDLDVPIFHVLRLNEAGRVIELHEFTQLEHALDVLSPQE